MELLNFCSSHISQAKRLAWENYQEQRQAVPALPEIFHLPDMEELAENGLGCAAFEKGKMVGFLCCLAPFENAFTTTAKGIFSPIYAHGAVRKGRVQIYQMLYQAAAQKWVDAGVSSHSIGLYVSDREAEKAFFQYGFGLRCVDAIRLMTPVQAPSCEGFSFFEVPRESRAQLEPLHRMLNDHFEKSPCFMKHTVPDRWIERKNRLFSAADASGIVAYIEIADTAENFVTELPQVQNICGAFCLPAYRGRGLYSNLLNFVIRILSAEGYTHLGVDYESFNPTAAGFWQKHFIPYTSGVVRRIDENVLTK